MAKISLIYPDSWLTISISIRNRDSWVEEFNWTMTEVGTTKVYKYDFTEVANTDYVYVSSCTWYDSMSGVVYMDITQWLTIEEHTHLMQLVNSTWGGGISSQAIQTSISNAKKEIIEKIEEIKPTDLTWIETKLNENYSHITLATDDILNTIKESETEICSDIIRSKKEIKEDNVSTRQLVRQKTEKLDKNISKLADRQDQTDKMIEDEADEIEKSLEQIYMQEAENIEKEMEDQYKKEAQEIEDEINKEINS